MLSAKQVADIITVVRVIVAPLLVWVGVTQGSAGLGAATGLVLAAWTGDVIDGRIARRSKVQYASWVGEHEGYFDVTICTGVVLYLLAAKYVSLPLGGLWLLVWAVVFWRWGYSTLTGQLYMAPIWGWFIVEVLRDPSPARWWLLGWFVVVSVFNWNRFAKDLMPGFITDMRNLLQQRGKGGA